MNNIDIADQVRGSYRFDHWMRKRKWWWSMFFCCYQVPLTNSFIVYKKYMLMHKQNPISHYEFNKAIALAWVDPASQYTLRKKRQSVSSTSTSVATQSTETKPYSIATRRRSLLTDGLELDQGTKKNKGRRVSG